MEISYSELALIINDIRDNGRFDGVDDLYEFMDKLDEENDLGLGITVGRFHEKVIVWKIDQKIQPK